MIIDYDDSDFTIEYVASILIHDGWIEEKQKTGIFKHTCMMTVAGYYLFNSDNELMGKFSPYFLFKLEDYLKEKGYEFEDKNDKI